MFGRTGWVMRAAAMLLAFLCLSGWSALSASAENKSVALVRAYNHTGLALFGMLAAEKGKENANLVISPYSIGTATAMAAAGARGKTAEEMRKLLEYPVPTDQLAPLAEILSLKLTQRTGEEDAEIEIANALHLTQEGDRILPEYKDLVRTHFGGEIFEGSHLEAINDWVGEKTHGRIPKILEQLSRSSAGVLLNAVYFKAGWKTSFDARATRPDAFHLSAGETVEVDTMHADLHAARFATKELDAAMLPYKGDRLSMVVVKSAGTGFEAPSTLSAKTARDLLDGLFKAKPERVNLSMPKFGFDYGTNLIPPFLAMGLKRPFDDSRANFSGIVKMETEADRIHISQIAHKAFVAVDENGTEAAAATAVEFSVRSLAPVSAQFKLDRPFLFMIVDRPSGAVLFIGRVSDPRAS